MLLENGTNINPLTLTPKHSIKGDLLFVEENKWRIGWDYDYKSGQFLHNGSITENLFTTGIIVETEAYAGKNDRGSHSYQNKKRKRI